MEYKVELKDWPYQVKAAVMRGNRPFMNHCHQEMEIILQKREIWKLRLLVNLWCWSLVKYALFRLFEIIA